MQPTHSGYSEVNGLRMYYEIYSEGFPLVLIHGGGSTIQSSFERIIPLLASSNQIIAVELQAHGRTDDRESELSFQQDADDVFRLLENLKISKANILGFSNGATTALQLAIRHPECIEKMILCSPLAKRNGVPSWFWGFMENASLDNMPQQLKDCYLKLVNSEQGLKNMHDKDAGRMVNFEDIDDELLESIEIPTLIVIGDQDIIKPEHALELHNKIKNSRVAIIPATHGEYLGEVTKIGTDYSDRYLITDMIEKFLKYS